MSPQQSLGPFRVERLYWVSAAIVIYRIPTVQRILRMKHLLRGWAMRGSLIFALTAACLVPIASPTAGAAQIGISFGGRSIGYSPYGQGRFGYQPDYRYRSRYSIRNPRTNSFPIYGSGPYRYGVSGVSRRNSVYRTYNTRGAYNSNYYNPYGRRNYNLYGF